MQIKYIEDYYDKIKERFPDLEIWEIEKILKHGMQAFFTLNSYGADVKIQSSPNSFLMYVGKLFFNQEIAKKYYHLKWRIKLRIKYFSKKPIWDGYYYFGLTEEEYKKYIPEKSGRFKYKITFDEIRAFKIKEEAYLYHKVKYLFRLKVPEDRGISFREKNFSTRNIELISIRDNTGKMKSTSYE